jgi:hypothetical protein
METMTDHSKTLIPHLDTAYRSKVMSQGSHDDAISKLADELGTDPDLLRHADQEATRLHSVRRQCFASSVSADFLKAAMKMARERSNAANQEQ